MSSVTRTKDITFDEFRQQLVGTNVPLDSNAPLARALMRVWIVAYPRPLPFESWLRKLTTQLLIDRGDL